MNLRRMTASTALAALLVTAVAVPALAEKGRGSSNDDREHAGRQRISGTFEDMVGVEWALSDVTKLYVKGIFKGQGEKQFAPRANMSHQESAVALVRLLDWEDQAKAMTEAEIAAELQALPDAKQIALWVRPSVALLVKSGIVSGTEAFQAMKPITRLETAVWLVKAMGWEAEAEAKMESTLTFEDAADIPAELAGYAAVAADHELIVGIDGKFVPNRPVMRVEMAVMMARADRILEDNDDDDEVELEFHGLVKSVDAAAGTLTIKLENGRERTFSLAGEAAIFVNSLEKDLADVAAGMRVELKLNAEGKVLFLEAKGESANTLTVSGPVTSLTEASETSLALVGINGTTYAVSAKAPIVIDGRAARLTDLQVGDTVKAVVKLGMVINLQAERTTPRTATVTGTLKAVTAARANAPARISVDVAEASQVRTVRYNLAADAVVELNGAAAQYTDLQEGDSVTLTLTGGAVTKVAAERQDQNQDQVVIEGNIIAIAMPPVGEMSIPELQGSVIIGYVSNGSYVTVTHQILTGTDIAVNGQAAAMNDLQAGDHVKATLAGSLLTRLEITR